MFCLRWLFLSLLLISIVSEPASPQARALLIYGHGGRILPLTNLSETGDDLSGGGVFGGGIGLQLGAATALRASVSVSESNLRGSTLSLSDPSFKRSYYGAELLFGSPTDAGLAPYLFFGGGRMTVDPAEPGTSTLAKLAGRAGTGVNYVPDNSFFVLFAELSGWVYQFDVLGFNRIQFEAALLGGLAFAIPF